MNPYATLPGMETDAVGAPGAAPRRRVSADRPVRLTGQMVSDAPLHSHAEVFYLQKQVQAQTPMVIVLVDGQKIEGSIEWYDRNALKVRGKTRMLIYKSAIKYMYKKGELGPDRAY
ncbi:MAG: RNA chaperone Hfq [Terracidiphilus sp.]